MANRIVSHKTVIGGKRDFCSPSLTLGWSIKNKNSTQWSIGKLEIFYDQ
jgi:hypothetical protein